MTVAARTLRFPTLVVLLGAAALVGAAAGAWIDWRFWNPSYGVQVVVVLGAVVALVVAAVLRRRLPGVLPLVLALVIGLGLGMALGPSREAPVHSRGTVEVRLEHPTAATGSMSADCSTTPSGDHGAISAGDAGDAMRPDPEHELTLVLTRGDMYDFGVGGRPDRLSLLILVRRIGAIDAESGPTETRYGSDPTSRLETTGSILEGSLTFDRLVRHPSSEGSEDYDVAGTITWSCAGPVANG